MSGKAERNATELQHQQVPDLGNGVSPESIASPYDIAKILILSLDIQGSPAFARASEKKIASKEIDQNSLK